EEVGIVGAVTPVHCISGKRPKIVNWRERAVGLGGGSERIPELQSPADYCRNSPGLSSATALWPFTRAAAPWPANPERDQGGYPPCSDCVTSCAPVPSFSEHWSSSSRAPSLPSSSRL